VHLTLRVAPDQQRLAGADREPPLIDRDLELRRSVDVHRAIFAFSRNRR
jgi:hypothetical protein